MIIILHGDNPVKTRQKLQDYISKAKNNHIQIYRLEPSELKVNILEEKLGSTSLFNEKKLLVLENLFSLKAKKELAKLIDLIGQSQENIILIENKKIRITTLKKIKDAKIEEFKLSSALFSFLDLLNPKLDKAKLIAKLHEAIISDGDWLVFSMLAWKIRLLIQAKEGNFAKMAPFMKSKLISQAKNFTLEQLIKFHHQLFLTDYEFKKSKNFCDLSTQLDILLFQL